MTRATPSYLDLDRFRLSHPPGATVVAGLRVRLWSQAARSAESAFGLAFARVPRSWVILVVVSCTPPTSASNPQRFLDAASSSAASSEASAPATMDLSGRSAKPIAVDASAAGVTRVDAAGAAVGTKREAGSGPARAGEVCATYSMMAPTPQFQRPCAPDLVCCVPPHGAVMQVETGRCIKPCKPTAPTSIPQVTGCSANGCPWAAVP